MTLRTCLAALVACATSAVADDAGPQRDSAGIVRLLVAPDYPSDALERGLTGRVVIEGVVNPATGKLADASYRPDRPESAIFVGATRSVVRLWTFSPPVKACMPTTERTVAELAFEIEGGKPRLNLTRGGAEWKPGPVVAPDYKIVKRLNPGYPRSMLSRNWTAIVYSRVEIDNAGKVVAVDSKAFSPDTAIEDNLEPFRKTAASTLRKWEFVPVPDDFKGPRVGCYDIKFQLTP